MQLAARLRQVRLHQSLSLSEVALRTGLTGSYLAGIEAGQEVPSGQDLEVLAEALEVPVHNLFLDVCGTPVTPRLTPRMSLQEVAQLGAALAPVSQESLRLASVLDALVRLGRDYLSARDEDI